MAEYVRFRLTTAKVGVSMALLALVAGAAEKAQAAANRSNASSAASFLKLTGLTSTIATDFNKLDNKLVKLTTAISSLEKKWVKVQGNLTRNYYKADKVNKTFLKIADAGAQYLKISDANFKYLKADGTAADSNKLGGQPASSFFQGNGNVVSGALSSITDNSQQLLSLPGGIIVVSVATAPGATGAIIAIHNGTGHVQAIASDIDKAPTVLQTGDTFLPAVQAGDFRLQIFPGAGLPSVVSILIGLTPNPAAPSQLEGVAQAFTGGV